MKVSTPKRNGRMRRSALLIAMVVTMALVAIVPAQASSGPKLFAPGATPYGKSMAEWSAKWWQWAVQQPTFSPCPGNQTGPVWFLFGNDPNPNFTCTVPSDKALLIPIINAEWSYAEMSCPFTVPGVLTGEAYLRACAGVTMD